MPAGIIYKLENTVNGMIYVGQTTLTLKQRFASHCATKPVLPLHRALRKYGPQVFTLSLLEEVETTEELDEAEVFWID